MRRGRQKYWFQFYIYIYNFIHPPTLFPPFLSHPFNPKPQPNLQPSPLFPSQLSSKQPNNLIQQPHRLLGGRDPSRRRDQPRLEIVTPPPSAQELVADMQGRRLRGEPSTSTSSYTSTSTSSYAFSSGSAFGFGSGTKKPLLTSHHPETLIANVDKNVVAAVEGAKRDSGVADQCTFIHYLLNGQDCFFELFAG
jgi:hypothetical protein